MFKRHVGLLARRYMGATVERIEDEVANSSAHGEVGDIVEDEEYLIEVIGRHTSVALDIISSADDISYDDYSILYLRWRDEAWMAGAITRK